MKQNAVFFFMEIRFGSRFFRTGVLNIQPISTGAAMPTTPDAAQEGCPS
jgi:hypothetical protein